MITDVNVQKLADLIAERDQLRSKCERLKGERDKLQKWIDSDERQSLLGARDHMNYCRSILGTPPDEVLSVSIVELQSQCAEMRSALGMAFNLIANSNPGAFKNGVTDQTGSIDEGDVIAGRIAEQCEKALSTDCGKAIPSRLEEARRLLSESTAINVEVSGDWMFRRDQWLKGQP